MSAQPVDPAPDPLDPAVILTSLPEREREFFLAQYRERAHAAADDVAGYQALQRFLRFWSIKARALQRRLAEEPDYYERLQAEAEGVRDGSIPTVSIEQALVRGLGMSPEDATAYWQELVSRAHERR